MPAVPNMFGDHCHTTRDVRGIMQANGGTWPGISDFNMDGWLEGLSPESKRYVTGSEWACVSLPEAFPCFATRGKDGESRSFNNPSCAPRK